MSGLQLGYTVVFGWYASFLFIRTGELLFTTKSYDPLLVAFCHRFPILRMFWVDMHIYSVVNTFFNWQ